MTSHHFITIVDKQTLQCCILVSLDFPNKFLSKCFIKDAWNYVNLENTDLKRKWNIEE